MLLKEVIVVDDGSVQSMYIIVSTEESGRRVDKEIAFGARCLRFNSWALQIRRTVAKTCNRCFISSKLCCPGAKPRRLTPPLVHTFGATPSNED